MMRIVIVCLAMCVLLAGCNQTPLPTVKPDEISGVVMSGTTSVSRYIDTQAGVVCWILRTGYAGGVSCLPIGQTRLEVGSD